MKIANDSETEVFDAYRCAKPKMTRGNWEECADGFSLNGEDVHLMYDTVRGTSFYFEWKGQWWRAPFWSVDAMLDKIEARKARP